MSKKIVLITCVAPKQKKACKAVEMYQGDLFKRLLKYNQDQDSDAAFILSGKYGLLDFETIIEPYDINLKDLPIEKQEAWATDVLKHLALKADLQKDKFIFLTSAAYLKYLVRKIKNFEIPIYIA